MEARKVKAFLYDLLRAQFRPSYWLTRFSFADQGLTAAIDLQDR